MIWLAWRTHRAALIIALVFLGIVATFSVITGLMMRADFTSLGLSACDMYHPSLACGDAWATFSGKYDVLTNWNELFTLTPLVAGILVGAPLVAREVERKTSLLVWTQGVTRMRWLVDMLLGVFAGTIALFAAFSFLNNWWLHPIIQLDGRFGPNIFDVVGIVPIAYAAFALALGIAAGALLGKTLPAILVTIVGYFPLRMAVARGLRPYHFVAPIDVKGESIPGQGPSDWILANGFMDRAGHPVDATTFENTCLSSPSNGTDSIRQCLHDHGWVQYAIYHPDAHFWPLQYAESAFFIALAVVLLAVTFALVRRREA
jgi:hypothetical protein